MMNEWCGHNVGDVLDLAWSPLDKWLASCSVDNSVIIWNAAKFPEMVCVLNGHNGLVKGVAWDPVGKYLASQSDDKSLRVWKTSDWTQEKVITDPFEECGGTTHILRLSWSPDGQYVLSAHAMNGGGPTAQVVEREGWRCDKDFVGHRKAVTCARFNSNIFVKEGKKCCCAAVGSRDRALSIWLTSLKRPLVVVHELFSDSVLDMSWSSDGLNLLACSSDGTVACIQFTNKEIGTPLTLEEKNALYEKIYGKCPANDGSGDLSSNLLVECPEILLAREKQEAKKELPKEESTPKSEKSQQKIYTPSPVSTQSSPALRPMDRQIETRTSDGKRRITPVFIPLTHADANESLGSQPGGLENCFSTSSQSKSRIRVERRDDIVIHPNVSNHAHSKTSDNALDQRLRKRTASTLPGPKAEDLQTKRPCPSPPPGQSQTSYLVPALSVPALGTAGPIVRAAGVLRLQKYCPLAPLRQSQASYLAPALSVPALGTAGPIVRAAGMLRLQVVNKACNTPYGKLSRLELIPNNSASNDPVWETYLGAAVSCIACDGRWVCVCCADGALHVWRLAKHKPHRALPPLGAAVSCIACDGRWVCVCCADGALHVWRLAKHKPHRALPPLALPSPAHKMTLSGDTLTVVTSSADLAIWDLPTATCTIQPLSFRNLLGNNTTVTHCSLLEDGNPMISFNTGKSYIYCKKLCAWVIWQDGGDPVRRAGGAGGSGRGLRVTSPLHANRAPHALRTHGKYSACAARSWLEAQVSSSLHLRLSKDYRHWIVALFSHLVAHGTEDHLRCILDDMLGPSHCTSLPKKWESTILDIKKHDLLEEMLALLVRQLRWQRLYTEYSDQLNEIKQTNGLLNGH
ncbi:unnamed protein product [Colias eurytheme]|nr:unnamed protein product [Colias eurytheme]